MKRISKPIGFYLELIFSSVILVIINFFFASTRKEKKKKKDDAVFEMRKEHKLLCYNKTKCVHTEGGLC